MLNFLIPKAVGAMLLFFLSSAKAEWVFISDDGINIRFRSTQTDTMPSDPDFPDAPPFAGTVWTDIVFNIDSPVIASDFMGQGGDQDAQALRESAHRDSTPVPWTPGVYSFDWSDLSERYVEAGEETTLAAIMLRMPSTWLTTFTTTSGGSLDFTNTIATASTIATVLKKIFLLVLPLSLVIVLSVWAIAKTKRLAR